MALFRYNGLNYYYELTGSGEPIILINGLSGDTRTMATLAERLKSSFTVINFDMRCAGQSDKPDEPFTISDIADETLALIKYLGYSRTNVLGFSMGGMIAMELVRRHRDIVNRLVLVSTTPSFEHHFPVSKKAHDMLHRTNISPALLKQVYETIFGSHYKKAHSFDEYLRFRMQDIKPQPANAYLHQLHACEIFDITEHVHEIDIPTQIVAGDEDELVMPKNSKWLHKSIMGSKLSILKGVGHMVAIEATDELARFVSKHISQKIRLSK